MIFSFSGLHQRLTSISSESSQWSAIQVSYGADIQPLTSWLAVRKDRSRHVEVNMRRRETHRQLNLSWVTLKARENLEEFTHSIG
jgi:hypothetical protein